MSDLTKGLTDAEHALQAKCEELGEAASRVLEVCDLRRIRLVKLEAHVAQLEEQQAILQRLVDSGERQIGRLEAIRNALARAPCSFPGEVPLECTPLDPCATHAPLSAMASVSTDEEEVSPSGRAEVERAEEDAKGPRRPVCSTCDDTHVMPETGFMCTRCPRPCEECRSRGPGRAGGPFCFKTPCACVCHAKHQYTQQRSSDAKPEIDWKERHAHAVRDRNEYHRRWVETERQLEAQRPQEASPIVSRIMRETGCSEAEAREAAAEGKAVVEAMVAAMPRTDNALPSIAEHAVILSLAAALRSARRYVAKQRRGDEENEQLDMIDAALELLKNPRSARGTPGALNTLRAELAKREASAWTSSRTWEGGHIEGLRRAIAIIEASPPCLDTYSPRPGAIDTAWPARDVVKKLADFADDRLRLHGYDGHGWEELQRCRDVAFAWLALDERSANPLTTEHVDLAWCLRRADLPECPPEARDAIRWLVNHLEANRILLNALQRRCSETPIPHVKAAREALRRLHALALGDDYTVEDDVQRDVDCVAKTLDASLEKGGA